MLKTHIGINDKVEETQRLLEYIIMEEEKLEEAKRTFDEDCEKFNKYLDEVERKAAEATEQAEVSTKRKNLKANEIAQLTEQINTIENDWQKVNDKLNMYEEYKDFYGEIKQASGKMAEQKAKNHKDKPV